MNEVVINADNEVDINGLMKEKTDPPTYVDNAVITWTLTDPSSGAVLGSGSFNYTIGSEGCYTTIIPASVTATLVANKQYNFNQNAVALSYTSLWTDVYVAVAAPSAQYTYALRQDIEDVYGITNVSKWADLENLEDPVYIDRRIVWALKSSYDEINTLLLGGPYAIPFANAPRTIVNLQAEFAGVLLYESRGIQDFNPDTGKAVHQLSWHRENVEKRCAQIKAGRIRLLKGDQVGTTVPRVIRQTPRFWWVNRW